MSVKKPTSLLLASNSLRRRQLIALGQWPVSISISSVDESQQPGEKPADYVRRLAEAKARAARSDTRPGQIILGADTTVVEAGSLLGKPSDADEAVHMLKRLRGHSHQVYTGLALLRVQDERLITDLCVTDVPMRNYSDDEILAYVRTGDPLDKAGAYAIQHPGLRPVEGLKGCYASVMGLPLCHLLRMLRQMEFEAPTDVPAACQAFLSYPCPVSAAILRGEQVG